MIAILWVWNECLISIWPAEVKKRTESKQQTDSKSSSGCSQLPAEVAGATWLSRPRSLHQWRALNRVLGRKVEASGGGLEV